MREYEKNRIIRRETNIRTGIKKTECNDCYFAYIFTVKRKETNRKWFPLAERES